MDDSPFPVKPIANAMDEAVEGQVEPEWKKGDRGRVIARTQAHDPYSREYVFVFAHTPFTVVPDHDKRRILEDHITIILRSADNGGGRILEIPAAAIEHVQ